MFFLFFANLVTRPSIMTLAFNEPYTAFVVRFNKIENIYKIQPEILKLFGIVLFTDFYRLIGIVYYSNSIIQYID